VALVRRVRRADEGAAQRDRRPRLCAKTLEELAREHRSGVRLRRAPQRKVAGDEEAAEGGDPDGEQRQRDRHLDQPEAALAANPRCKSFEHQYVPFVGEPSVQYGDGASGPPDMTARRLGKPDAACWPGTIDPGVTIGPYMFVWPEPKSIVPSL